MIARHCLSLQEHHYYRQLGCIHMKGHRKDRGEYDDGLKVHHYSIQETHRLVEGKESRNKRRRWDNGRPLRSAEGKLHIIH